MEPTPSEEQDLAWETLSIHEKTLLDQASRDPNPMGGLNVAAWPEAAQALAEPTLRDLSRKGLIALDESLNFTLTSIRLKQQIIEITGYIPSPISASSRQDYEDDTGWLID